MEELEEIFNESAKKNMIQWDLKSFKRTHPRLLRAILEAMDKCKNDLHDKDKKNKDE